MQDDPNTPPQGAAPKSALRRVARAILPRPALDALYRRYVQPAGQPDPGPPASLPETAEAPGAEQPAPPGPAQSPAPEPSDPGADADAAATRSARVTVLTDIPFWESAYGSHARLQSILAAIASECDLTVFVFKTVGRRVKSQLAQIGATYRVVSYKDYEEKAAEPLKPGKVGQDPALRGRIVDSWVRSTKRFLARHPQDTVIVEYIDRSYLLDAVPPGTARLLDAHDVMSSRIGVFARFGKVPSINMSAADEARIMAHYDAIIAISAFDAADISRRLGLRRVLTVPHAIPAKPLFECRPVGRRLIFTGANSEPNVEGLRWFLDQVWPVIRHRFDLSVVGTVCDSAPKDVPGVTLMGRVEDLDGAMAAHDIAINPVFIGGGLKIKTVDALSVGLPSVNCSEAVRGIEHLAGSALAVANTRAAFIGTLNRLRDTPEERQAMSDAALAAVEAHFAPEHVFRDLLNFLTRTRRSDG